MNLPGLGRARVIPSEDPEELYEHAPCGYVSTLPDDTIIKINRTLLDWLGFERGDVVGKLAWTDLLSAGSRIYHETHHRPTLSAHGSVWEAAADMRCADGRTLPVLLNSVVAKDEEGRVRTVRTSVFDARLRREYEQELLRARRRAEEQEGRARDLATTLQASLMPPVVPVIPGLDIGAAYRPAGDGAEVGGDFYDLFETTSGNWVAALGDVQGKGPAAAAVTGLLRYSIRAASIAEERPSRILDDVNSILLHDATDRLCTALCARVTVMADGRCEVHFAMAGHPRPLLVTPDAVQPVGEFGQLLGLLPEVSMVDNRIKLLPGQGLLMYTDGLTEARAGAELLEEEGLLQLVDSRRTFQAPELVAGLADAVVEFQRGQVADDMAILYIRVPVEGERTDVR